MENAAPARRRVHTGPLAAAILVIGAACFVAGWFARPSGPRSAVAYGEVRLSVIRAHLREVASPYLFLAGDSYAELDPAERPPCGLDVVNGGISGLKTGEYLQAVRTLSFERPPAVVLLTIGTNDLLAKHDPAGSAAMGRFRADADALIQQLAVGGAKVVVAAVPPIPAELGRIFAPPAFKLYSDVLAEICGKRGCRFVDPYAASRSGEFWRGREGTSPDGLHLGDLRGAYRTISDALCR